MIYIGSRYQSEPVTYLLDGRSGRTHATVFRGQYYTDESIRTARWKAGLRMDVVSDNLLNDPTKWWTIMDYNADTIDPMSFVTGQAINLP